MHRKEDEEPTRRGPEKDLHFEKNHKLILCQQLQTTEIKTNIKYLLLVAEMAMLA